MAYLHLRGLSSTISCFVRVYVCFVYFRVFCVYVVFVKCCCITCLLFGYFVCVGCELVFASVIVLWVKLLVVVLFCVLVYSLLLFVLGVCQFEFVAMLLCECWVLLVIRLWCL